MSNLKKENPRCAKPRAKRQNKRVSTMPRSVKRRKPTFTDCLDTLDELASASPAEAAATLGVAAVEIMQVGGKSWQGEAQQTLLQVAKGSEVEAPAAQQVIRDGFRCEAHPDGRFSLEMDGLWFTEHKENGDSKRTWLGPPLLVLGQTRDERSSEWGLLLKWFDPDGQQHTWAMPKSLLVGKDKSAWLGRLVGEGWCAAPGSKEQQLIALYFMAHQTKHRALCVSRTGWHSGVFVLPDAVFMSVKSGESALLENTSVFAAQHTKTDVGPVGPERIVLQGQKHENPYRTAGTLEGWQWTIGLWAQGNSRLMFFLSASLCAPLLELVGAESWGVNLHGGTSSAKTTTLQAAATVWGNGGLTGGYVKSWRATDNSLEGEAEMHNDTALCLDELGQASARTLNEASYMLFNSMGKGRASRSGDSKPRKKWRTVVLSTAEKTLAEKMAEEGMKPNPGQSVRLIELFADAGKGFGAFETLHGHVSAQEFADAIKGVGAQHYGHAGRAFVEKLVENKAEVTAWLQDWMGGKLEEFCSEGATGQVKRGARHFMLAAAAGELASKCGIVPWKEDEALKAAKKCFSAWVDSRGGKEDEAEEETRIVSDVKLFLEMHGSSRFQHMEGPMNASEKVFNRVGFVKTEGGKTTYYCLPEAFKNEVCKGCCYKLAQRVLAERGVLIKDGKNYTVKPPRLPEVGRKRVYALVMPVDEERPDSPDISLSPPDTENDTTLHNYCLADSTDRPDTKNDGDNSTPNNTLSESWPGNPLPTGTIEGVH